MTRFDKRFAARKDEFEWLYMELYGDRAALHRLEAEARALAAARPAALKRLDARREADPLWYRKSGMLGMTLYADLFAEDLAGVRAKIPYFKEQGITYLHLMPLLQMPHPDNDGGYAVEDYGQVDPALGTNGDLVRLTDDLRGAGISLCLDFVMNHTASTHAWALKARAGDPVYRAYYHVFDTYDIPAAYEKTVPQVFPATAPGNFTRFDEMNAWVMTTFNAYQWDLNYANPEVLREMALAMLRLANMGVEILRIDAAPYIWKELGTNCRNHPKVHTVLRLMRIIVDCACPAVLLKGEVVMAPRELAPYFGTPEKPECHLLYNASGMVNLWSALAARDARLLKAQLDALNGLPAHCWFVNYLRCHDDIGWGLDEEEERRRCIDPQLHKEYLYRFYAGEFPGSYARGMTYNYDPVTRDARSCGTTASLCGLDAAQDGGAVNRILLMHAAMLSIKGLPMLNCGDEVAQRNDLSYLDDPARKGDARHIHRSPYDWRAWERRADADTPEGRVYAGLRALEKARASLAPFSPDARVSTWDTGCDRALAVVRRWGGEELVCLFNFSDQDAPCRLPRIAGVYRDVLTGEHADLSRGSVLAPYRFAWLMKG